MPTNETDFDIASNTHQELNVLKQKLFNFGHDKMNEAIKIMVFELAEGLKNTELLTELIAKRLTHIEGEVKVLDHEGNLTDLSLDDLKKEFATTPKYFGLIRRSKATGGGGKDAHLSLPKTNNISTQYTTPLLDLLNKAVNEFWINFDESSPPKAEAIIDWLMAKNVSEREALAIDNIIRPPKFKGGGNRSHKNEPRRSKKT